MIVIPILIAAALSVAAIGALIGAGHVERRIAADCNTKQEARVAGLLFACQMAPGWRE